MKQFFTLILCIAITIGYCQDTSAVKTLFSTCDLRLADPLVDSSAHGTYSYGDGRVAYVLNLNKDGSFEKYENSCLLTLTLAKGKYRISNKKTVLLKGEGEFYIYLFDKFRFLVPVTRDEQFRKEFTDKAKEQFKTKAKKDEARYTDQFFIVLALTKTYYSIID